MHNLSSGKSNRRDNASVIRERLLNEAAKLVANEGIAGLTARRLAAAADASTKVVYSHFGGMPGIIAALYENGFHLLASDLAAASQRAQSGLLAVASAYRRFAHEHRDLFDLMYGRSVTHFLPTPESRTSAKAALDVLVSHFANHDAATANDLARSFWAAMHGVVALERAGWFDEIEADWRLSKLVIDYHNNSN
jgi:AcrR family transcriptional regulator